MFVAERDIAAGPGVGFSSTTSTLKRCWADSENARRALSEGRFDAFSSTPCGAAVDEDGIGLCAACREDILG